MFGLNMYWRFLLKIQLVFEKNIIVLAFAESWEKSLKIVITTSTPGVNPVIVRYNASVVHTILQLH
jgi:hypothetical protein